MRPGIRWGRSVLVGVGNTDRTPVVAQLGQKLARIFDDRLVLVHADDHSRQGAVTPEPGDASAQLPCIVREVHKRAGADTALVLASGPAGYVLDRASDRENARLIVIGAGRAERASGSREPLAIQLAGIARCPAVVLPDDAPWAGFLQPTEPDRIGITTGPDA